MKGLLWLMKKHKKYTFILIFFHLNAYICNAMKVFSILLCSLILFLVTIPSIKILTTHNTSAESCCNTNCETSTENEQSHEEENCTGSSCNPFATCCSCVLYVFSSIHFNIQKPEINIAHQFTYASNFKSQFSIDFWQPPKLV
jgi:hypothetical protein